MKIFLKPAVTLTILTGCAGPAGVAPEKRLLDIRSCVLDAKAIDRAENLTMNTAACDYVTIAGPLAVPANKNIVIKNAKDLVVHDALRIDGSLTIESDGPVTFREQKDAKESYLIEVTGQFLTKNVSFSGPANLVFGSETSGPKAIDLLNAHLTASPAGAPSLTFYGDTIGCSDAEKEPTYKFTNVTATALKNNSLNLFNMPSSIDGIDFKPTADNETVNANLGKLCIGKNKTYNLANPSLIYSAEEATVLGTLNLSTKQFTLTGDQPFTIDGGALTSNGNETSQSTINFVGQGSPKTKNIIVKNGALVTLSRSTVKNANVRVSAAKITMDKSKVVGACSDSILPECTEDADKAALVLEKGAQADLNETELEPKTESQILVIEDEGQPSVVLARGNPDDYKAKTNAGLNFYLHQRLFVQINVPVEKHIAEQLTALNGTYEGPCIKGEGDASSTFRHRFTYDNEFYFHNAPNIHPYAAFHSHGYVPKKLLVRRTTLTYEGDSCQKLISTNHYVGQANYFVSQTAHNFHQTLLQDVFYDFKQTLWTYHYEDMIKTLNDQKVCGLDTWSADVAQDITGRECYGAVIWFDGYFDRFEKLEHGNLFLSLDVEQRPENLVDLSPETVNRAFEYVKIH